MNDDVFAAVAAAISSGSRFVDSDGGTDVLLLLTITFRGTVLRGIGRATLVVLNILLFLPPPLPEEVDLGDISSTNLVFFDGSIIGGRLGLGRFLGIAVIVVDVNAARRSALPPDVLVIGSVFDLRNGVATLPLIPPGIETPNDESNDTDDVGGNNDGCCCCMASALLPPMTNCVVR